MAAEAGGVRTTGAPIDAVGCKAHGTGDLSAAAVKRFIDTITSETSCLVGSPTRAGADRVRLEARGATTGG